MISFSTGKLRNKNCFGPIIFFFNYPNWEKFVEKIGQTNWWNHLMNSLNVCQYTLLNNGKYFSGLHTAKQSAHSMNSLSSESSSRMSSVATPSPPPKDASVYEKLSWCHQFDTKSKEDVAMNRRVGFYKFKSEIGAGNFSKVKLAHHQLTNGTY